MLVFTVSENIDKYRDKPTGQPRHRLCRKCLEAIEAKDHFMFKILYEYPSKTKDQEPLRSYRERSLRQKLMSKHHRIADDKKRNRVAAAKEFSSSRIDLKS